MKLNDLFLGVLSGLLLTFSFPNFLDKFGYPYLAWVALVPLFWAVRGKHLRDSFFLGFIAGVVHFSGLLYWVVYVATTYGKLPIFVAVAVMTLLVLYLSLYLGVFALLLRFFEMANLNHILWAPILWVSLEYIRSFLLTGFPWENLGYSQFFMLKVIQISDIFGVYGVSFVILLANGLIFSILSESIPWSQRVLRKEVFITIGVVVCTLSYGSYRMNQVDSMRKGATAVDVALVQGSIDQAIKWNPSFQEETVDIYRRLTLDSIGSDPCDLIVWPETATPFYFLREQDYSPLVLDMVKEAGGFLLLGSPAYELKDGGVKIFNRAYLISPQAKIQGFYDKVHLVPFGEYVPLQQYLPFAKKLVGEVGVGDFSAGETVHGLKIYQGKLGVLICFESIFPELSRKLVRNEVGILVNITNDAWFGKSSAPYQHFSMAVLRAVENRVPVVRCANTGVSGFIDSCGRIKQYSPLFKRLTMRDIVEITRVTTFYTRYGDVFAMLCLFFSCILIARCKLKWMRRR